MPYILNVLIVTSLNIRSVITLWGPVMMRYVIYDSVIKQRYHRLKNIMHVHADVPLRS